MMSEGEDNIGKVSVLVEKDFLGNVDLTFEIHTHIIFYMTLRKIKSSFLHSLPHIYGPSLNLYCSCYENRKKVFLFYTMLNECVIC